MKIPRLFFGEIGLERTSPARFLNHESRLDLGLNFFEEISDLVIRAPEVCLPADLVLIGESASVLLASNPVQQLQSVVCKKVWARHGDAFPGFLPDVTPFEPVLYANRKLHRIRVPADARPSFDSERIVFLPGFHELGNQGFRRWTMLLGQLQQRSQAPLIQFPTETIRPEINAGGSADAIQDRLRRS